MIRGALKAGIKIYTKGISPLIPPSCRFYPTCSAYAIEAIDTHGACKGSWLAVKRICRCHPFDKGEAFDPVPPVKKRTIQDALSESD
ncbi:MAG: membrane protein insertion efficiency factor YidD [Micavibrio sp.]|nr:membrane protein insertion efficiency factor YidD [Micavibrio sp.]